MRQDKDRFEIILAIALGALIVWAVIQSSGALYAG